MAIHDNGGMRRLATAVIAEYGNLLRRYPIAEESERSFIRCREAFRRDGLEYWFMMAERIDLYDGCRHEFLENASIREWQSKHPESVLVSKGYEEEWKMEREKKAIPYEEWEWAIIAMQANMPTGVLSESEETALAESLAERSASEPDWESEISVWRAWAEKVASDCGFKIIYEEESNESV